MVVDCSWRREPVGAIKTKNKAPLFFGNIAENINHIPIKTLGTETAVEALGVSILPRTDGINEPPFVSPVPPAWNRIDPRLENSG